MGGRERLPPLPAPHLRALGVSSEADSYYFVELAYSKLHDAGWRSWPEAEQAAIASFLTTRWSVGLTQNPPSTIDPTFDAADWPGECGRHR